MNKKTKLNFIDVLLLLTVVFSLYGVSLVKAEKSSLNKVIKGKSKVVIEVFIPDVKSKFELFQTGSKTAITIRNQPYDKLEIIGIKQIKKEIILPDLMGGFKVIDDPIRVNEKDILVTLVDHALITDDGYVFGGNKIKIGNYVELEGFNYRLTGKVVDMYALSD